MPPALRRSTSHVQVTAAELTYNGQGLDAFVPERTAAYISQLDDHYGELTVRETLEFAARVQGGRLGEPIVRSELFLGSEGVWGRKAYGEKWRMERMQRQERPVPAMIASGSGSEGDLCVAGGG